MGRTWSKLAGISASLSVVLGAEAAHADSGIDSPESGVVQMGRGSAWVARADDPLAAYFNPAAMAFQASGVHLGAQLIMKSQCFTRLGPDGQPVAPDTGIPAPLNPGQPLPADGSTPPSNKVCANIPPFPNPQIGAVFRVHDRVAVGLALVAPHSAGKADWGESLPYTNARNFPSSQPSPQRYSLASSNALIVFPTVSVAYAPLDNLSFGAGFVWGIGTVDFITFSQAVNGTAGATADHATGAGGDVRAELKAKDLFIPGVILSALWMPTKNFDIAAWYKWSDALKASTDVTLTAAYWKTSGAVNPTYCADAGHPAGCNVTNQTNAGNISVNLPMEAKLGFRYHHPRAEVTEQPAWASVPGRTVRDPLSQDLFDVEVDFTYANNSAVQDLQIGFNCFNPQGCASGASGIAINDGTKGGVGSVPVNANIPHHWKDVVGVRLGGDVNVIPNRLALRAGGWFETKGQDDAYLALDFDLAMKGGAAGGATVRVGPVDISVGYQHTFWGTLNNLGKGAVYALSGDGSACGKTPVVGPGCFRSWQAVNGGSLTGSMNEFGLSGTAHW